VQLGLHNLLHTDLLDMIEERGEGLGQEEGDSRVEDRVMD
jgi:hypothetical protein